MYNSEIQKLKRFDNDLKWFQDNYQLLKEKYKGEYVAILEGTLIDHDSDARKLIVRLKHKGYDTSSMVIEFINEHHKVFVL